MRICKLDGCEKNHAAKGYCTYHYRMYGRPFVECSWGGCDRMSWTKGLCRRHYRPANKRYDGELCMAPGCKTRVSSVNIHCSTHKKKLAKGMSLDKKYTAKGSRNGMWKGGVAEYPDHHIFKKNRLIKLKEANYRCEECGQGAKQVHHIDGTKHNHTPDNLMALCQKCHMGIYHNGGGRKPKYGSFSVKQISVESGLSPGRVRTYFLHKGMVEWAIKRLENKRI